MLVDNYCLCFMFNMRQRKTMHFVFWNKYCLSPLLLWLITRTLISFLLKSKSLSPGVYSYIYFNFTRGNSNPCYSNLTHYLQSTFRFLSSHFLYNFTLDNSNHVNAWQVITNSVLLSKTLNVPVSKQSCEPFCSLYKVWFHSFSHSVAT